MLNKKDSQKQLRENEYANDELGNSAIVNVDMPKKKSKKVNDMQQYKQQEINRGEETLLTQGINL